ncbi:MAG: SRPBCC domain-containing protein [Chloroflexota bacterium]
MRIPTPPDPTTLPDNIVYAQIHIDAPPEAVWHALTDFERYPLWNSFTLAAKAQTLVVDAPLTLRVRMRRGFVLNNPERIVLLEPPNAVAWRAENPVWLVRAVRYQLMQPTTTGTTYITWEQFEGPMVSLMRWIGILGDVQRGFDTSAADLKRYVEANPGMRVSEGDTPIAAEG